MHFSDGLIQNTPPDLIGVGCEQAQAPCELCFYSRICCSRTRICPIQRQICSTSTIGAAGKDFLRKLYPIITSY